MKKLWTLCTCCLSVGMMWAQTGNWTDEGNYDTSWWDGNNRSEYHITTAEQLAGLSYLSQQGHHVPAKQNRVGQRSGHGGALLDTHQKIRWIFRW